MECGAGEAAELRRPSRNATGGEPRAGDNFRQLDSNNTESRAPSVLGWLHRIESTCIPLLATIEGGNCGEALAFDTSEAVCGLFVQQKLVGTQTCRNNCRLFSDTCGSTFVDDKAFCLV